MGYSFADGFVTEMKVQFLFIWFSLCQFCLQPLLTNRQSVFWKLFHSSERTALRVPASIFILCVLSDNTYLANLALNVCKCAFGTLS